MTLVASVDSQREGFAAQDAVLRLLRHSLDRSWTNSRELIDPSEGNINLAEKRRGDLTNRRTGLTVEVQTSERPSLNVGWKRSKYLLSEAHWQCFVYRLPEGIEMILFIRTDELKYLLGSDGQIRWERYERDSVVLLYHEWLRKSGAKTLDEFVKLYS